jgi:hypothetical protein
MATTAKSKTVTYADLINAADLEGMKKAEQAHADLDALREQIDKWGEEHSEAASRLRWMESSFVRGNDAVSVEDYALAIARAKRAEFLAHAHTETEDKRIQIAERKLPPTEKKLAKAVAAALETLLPGIPVLTTFGKVPDPTEADLPVAVVSRNKPTGIGWAGLVPSGDCLTSSTVRSPCTCSSCRCTRISTPPAWRPTWSSRASRFGARTHSDSAKSSPTTARGTRCSRPGLTSRWCATLRSRPR